MSHCAPATSAGAELAKRTTVLYALSGSVECTGSSVPSALRFAVNVAVSCVSAFKTLAFAPAAERVPQWWDLARLSGLYDEFLASYGPVLAAYRRREGGGGNLDEAQAFADYVTALTDWRRLPYLEPGLPADVLPAGWNGLRAAETFFELRGRLEAGAVQDVNLHVTVSFRRAYVRRGLSTMIFRARPGSSPSGMAEIPSNCQCG